MPELEQRAAVDRPLAGALGQRPVGGAGWRRARPAAAAAGGVEPPLGAERAELLQPSLQRDHGGADVAALVRQHAHPDAPAAVQRAEQAVGRQRHVGEEDLVELGAAGHLAQRADLDARQVHRAQEERDAVVLAGLRVRPGHQDAPVADPPAGAPHLLAVDDEAVAVPLGPRRQRCRGRCRRRARRTAGTTPARASSVARRCCACCSGVP